MGIQVPYSKRTAGPFNAAPGQVQFDFPWPVLSAGDLTVTRERGGGSVALALTTDYVVNNVGAQGGGSVILTVGALAGDIIAIDGTLKPERATSYASGVPFTSTQVDTDLRRLIIMVQELRRDADRSIRRPPTDPNLATDGELLADTMAGMLLGFDSLGNVVPVNPLSLGTGGGGGGVTFPIVVSQGGTGGTTQAQALNNLGLGGLAVKTQIGPGDVGPGAIVTAGLANGAVTPVNLATGAVTLVVESATLLTPPIVPLDNRAWIVPVGAGVAWGMADNSVALRIAGAWVPVAPAYGWRAISLADSKLYAFSTQWLGINPNNTISGRLVTQIMQGRAPGQNNRAVVLDNKDVAVWGWGTNGKACTAGGRSTQIPEIIPFETPPNAIVKLLSTRGRHYVIDDQGNVHSAGDGTGYVLGHGDQVPRQRFRRIDFFYQSGIKIKDVICSRFDASSDSPCVFFLTQANQVYAVAPGNTGGALGNGTVTSSVLPQPVIDASSSGGTGPLNNVDTLSASGSAASGAISVIARLLDGRVARWGWNGFGQLGDGTTTSILKATPHPTISNALSVLSMSGSNIAGTVFGGTLYVLLSNGSVVGAGRNSEGQLGLGADVTNKSQFVNVPLPEIATAIFGSDGFAGSFAALTVTNKVVMLGYNSVGQCGSGNVALQTTAFYPAGAFQGFASDVKFGGVSDGQLATFIRAGNVIYATGYNVGCQLCDGSTATNATLFGAVQGLPAGLTIADWNVPGEQGQFGPMVLTTDGRVWTGGSGVNGELGWQTGVVGISPFLEEVYIRGQRGGKGDTGITGAKGAQGWAYLFKTGAPGADPGAGYLQVGSVTPGATTTLSMPQLSNDAQTTRPWTLQWGDSSSTIRGRVDIRDINNAANFLLLNVTGAVTDNGTWVSVPVQVVAAGGAFVNNQVLNLNFIRTGDGPQAAAPANAALLYALMFG